MAHLALTFKIDEASRNYWRTKDPKFKKEWYRLINLFCKISRKKTQPHKATQLKNIIKKNFVSDIICKGLPSLKQLWEKMPKG